MKTRILLVLFIIISCTIYSQDSSFQLKDYKYRTPGFQSLTLNIDLGGNVLSRKWPTLLNNETQRSFQLYPSTINYYRTSSTDKKIKSEYYNLRPSFTASSITRDSYKSKTRSYQAPFYAIHDNRYYKPGKWFFELNNFLDGDWYQNKNSDTSGSSKRNKLHLRDNFSIGFGKGRIELVQDAQMAMFILNDLQEMGLLENEVTPELARDLAVLITEMNNKRIFDSRRRRIYELTQIESFLKNKGLTGNTDIRHFTLINDNWAFANNPIRQSGSAWFIRMQANGEFFTDKSKTLGNSISKSKGRDYRIGVGPQVGYERYHPVNLHWQTNFSTTLSWKYYETDHIYEWEQPGTSWETGSHTFESGLNYFLSYGLAYYPNTRTIINGTASLEAVKHWFDPNATEQEEYGARSSVSLSADYFIGYRTRFNAGVYFFYDKWRTISNLNVKNNYHYLNSSFSAGLFHTIF